MQYAKIEDVKLKENKDFKRVLAAQSKCLQNQSSTATLGGSVGCYSFMSSASCFVIDK